MPEGIVTTVEDGFAYVDFVDGKQRGRYLSRLIAEFGAEVIETLTRSGPRRIYRVPEGNARAVGLVDGVPATAPEPAPTETNYDDGKPDADWHRAALDEYAVGLGLNPKDYRSKATLLKAIRAADTA